MEVIMPKCGVKTKDEWPDGCNVNLYRNGEDSVGWHSDDEDLFLGARETIRIISLSLGQQ